MHNERFALILVDHLDPARIAEDELEPDRMVVDIVGDGAAVRNHDVRRNESPTETAGDQVAVLHARPADTGLSIGSPGDHELRDEIRDDERPRFDRDNGSLRSGGVEPDQPVGAVEIGDPGGVGRRDGHEPVPLGLEPLDRCAEIVDRDHRPFDSHGYVPWRFWMLAHSSRSPTVRWNIVGTDDGSSLRSRAK